MSEFATATHEQDGGLATQLRLELRWGQAPHASAGLGQAEWFDAFEPNRQLQPVLAPGSDAAIQNCNVGEAHLAEPRAGNCRANETIATEHDVCVAHRNQVVGALDGLA